MIKKLSFMAALWLPGLAYAGNPSADLSVQIVPAPPPAPAVAAGFTTLTLNADFSTPFYANKANWLDCGGATSPQWYKQWVAFGSNGVAAPCSAILQETDPLTGRPA